MCFMVLCCVVLCWLSITLLSTLYNTAQESYSDVSVVMSQDPVREAARHSTEFRKQSFHTLWFCIDTWFYVVFGLYICWWASYQQGYRLQCNRAMWGVVATLPLNWPLVWLTATDMRVILSSVSWWGWLWLCSLGQKLLVSCCQIYKVSM